MAMHVGSSMFPAYNPYNRGCDDHRWWKCLGKEGQCHSTCRQLPINLQSNMMMELHFGHLDGDNLSISSTMESTKAMHFGAVAASLSVHL